MFRKTTKRLFQILLIPVIGGIIGMLLLAAAFLLPTERILRHVQASVDMLNRETVYFSVTPTLKGSQLDNFTEALYLNQALINTKNADLAHCVLSGYIYNVPGQSGNPVEILSQAIEQPENRAIFGSTTRFFNGYETVVKPLLILTDYSGIRQFNLYVSLFLTLTLFSLMIKRNLKRFILPVIVSLLFIRPLTMALNMTFFGFYVCMLVPCICILGMKKETLREKAWLLFGISGASTYYFNMNYVQFLSFGIPALFYFLVIGPSEKPAKMIKTIAYLFFAWIVGCVGMMVFKWIVYEILVDPAFFGKMKEHFLSSANNDKGSRWNAIAVNWETAFGNGWWGILELLFIFCNVFEWIRRKKTPTLSKTDVLLLCVMFILPNARYFILSNHVTIHHWVTYRLLMMPVLTCNILIAKSGAAMGYKSDEV